MRRLLVVTLLALPALAVAGQDQKFTQGRDVVWSASVAVATELGAITTAEKEAGVLVYRVGGFSSGGRTDVSVTITANGSGTKVAVNSTHGYQGLLGIGKNNKVQKQFLRALEARLATAENTTPAEQR